MIHDCSFVLCWLFMSPLFVLNSWTEHCSSDKSSTFCRFCSFPAFLHIWTLSSSDCMILRSIFSHWGQLMDSNTTIKKGSNIHWCSRRKHDALRAGCWNFWTGWRFPNFFFCWNIYFFPFITALRKHRRYLHVSPEDKLSTIYLDLQIQKVFPFRLLMHRVFFNSLMFFWSISECWKPFYSCVWGHQLSSVWKMDLKIIQSLLERVQYAKCWKTAEIYRTWRICLKNSAQFNCSEQTRDSMNNQHKTKEQSWISSNLTQY